MKTVGVLTDFYGEPDPAYSLCRVAGNQLKMLLRAGYKPVLIADQAFCPTSYPWDAVEEIRYLPGLPRWNEIKIHETWNEDLAKMTSAMESAVSGLDIVLTHDLIYQPAQLLHNMAARAVAKEHPEIHWLHLIHSATTPAILSSRDAYLRLAHEKFPNSFILFPNEYSIPRVARNFHVEEDEVKCVHHAVDWCESKKYEEETAQLIDAKRMLQADVIGCYPIRLDRGKQVEFPIRIFAQLKRLWKSVRLVIVDFHSTGGDKVLYRKELHMLGERLGLSGDELIFTSEYKEAWEVRVPHEVVMDLMDLSNVYIHSSRSETYSLTTQEAGISRSFLVLNRDFPPTRSIYGEWPVYFQFGSNIDALTGLDGDTHTEYHPSVEQYCYDIAMRIAYELKYNRVLAEEAFLRKNRNLDSIFRNELEPLLYAFDG